MGVNILGGSGRLPSQGGEVYCATGVELPDVLATSSGSESETSELLWSGSRKVTRREGAGDGGEDGEESESEAWGAL